MKYLFKHIQTAIQILDNYDGTVPLSIYLKQYFSQHKKFGSKDRKQIAAICFGYFRVKAAFPEASKEQVIIYSLFLCNDADESLDPILPEELQGKSKLSLEEKLALLSTKPEDLFLYPQWLSNGINLRDFAMSFLQQPDVFVRVRRNKQNLVEQQLSSAGIPFRKEGEDLLRISTGQSLQDVIELNRDGVIQDKNSAQVLNWLNQYQGKSMPMVWDCCAASGGKSILIYDLLKGKLRLTVTDIRESILKNLQYRLRQAGVPIIRQAVMDLTKPVSSEWDKFDIIVCDAPCSGSGTWGRTPEQMLYFDERKLNAFVEKQRAIIANAVTFLEDGGYFCYITCSVFEKENHAQMNWILQQFGLKLISSQTLTGYNDKADSMFYALFQKS